MADLIVIRLHLEKPVAAGDFTTYLTGLTINSFDLPTGDPMVGRKIGDATYIAPPSNASRIFQHVNSITSASESVTTAVIEISLPAGDKDYVDHDFRIEVKRGITPVVDKTLYYNVPIASVSPISNPGQFPGLSPVLCHYEAVLPVSDPSARRHQPFVKPAPLLSAAEYADGSHP